MCVAEQSDRTGGTMSEGTKHDSGKSIRPELIPPEAIEALGTVLAFGAKKYADRNWELGMNWSRVFGATMRHLWSWWKKEEADPETGYSPHRHGCPAEHPPSARSLALSAIGRNHHWALR